jgi:hypothetical protein
LNILLSVQYLITLKYEEAVRYLALEDAGDDPKGWVEHLFLIPQEVR